MSVQEKRDVTERPRGATSGARNIPTTGMRGGLGRTLLTAFLILAIVPLSTISWYATQRERRDIQNEVMTKLSAMATMMEIQIEQWLDHRTVDLALLADWIAAQPAADDAALRAALRTQLNALIARDPAFRRLAVLDAEGREVVAVEAHAQGRPASPCAQTAWPNPDAPTNWTLDQPIPHRAAATEDKAGLWLTLRGWLDRCALVETMDAMERLGSASEIYLVDANGIALSQGRPVSSSGIHSALAGRDTAGLQLNYANVPVIGVYRWLPELGVVLVAEQTQEAAFASTDNITAAVIGATLGVALATAVIAAFVTRQITRPIVQLTESALRIAEGDMEQRVPVTSRDEIGILAYVFNRMAAELKALYDDLEDKVAQRTALLQKANYQIQRRAIQLATTVEVSQAATSILEPEALLQAVVKLVHDSFSYSYVGIYLLSKDGRRATLQQATGGAGEVAALKKHPVWVEEETELSAMYAVSQAARSGEPCIVRWDVEQARDALLSPYIRAEAALPLKMRDAGQGNADGRARVIGVLDILSHDEDDFNADDVSVLQNVANQITIALENARMYVTEREAANQLRELDQYKRRFLVNMSHELRTPLTNIIGFSRLMLKGIDGPLEPQQENDLQIIYHNGQHLLGLINDLLDVSQIEAGLVELEFREVNLPDLINSVMATASAMVRDRDIELRQEIAPALPTIQADAARIRQVLLRLLTNAAKFTQKGAITVRSWASNGQVLVSVSDTGIGIPPEEHERIFRHFEQGILGNGRKPEGDTDGGQPRGQTGAGLGLALSKEFVEMHGGRIWVESEVGRGSTFTFSLPVSQESRVAAEHARSNKE